jgi:hypothetical protein
MYPLWVSPHKFRLKGGSFIPHDLVQGVFRVFRRAQEQAGQLLVQGSFTYVSSGVPSAREAAPNDSAALDQIRSILGLSEGELADLFSVRRESVTGWRKNGIPEARRASVARLLDLSRILFRDIKPERIPEIVRTPDDWLENGTILETIKREGAAPVYTYLRRLFSYAG